MSWRAITEDDIYSALNATEATALRAAIQRPGQEDPLDVIIQQVTGYCRDAIRSHSGNSLHATTTYLPEGVIPQAVDLIIYRLGLRLSRVLPIDESRRSLKADAESYFDKIARGARDVESPGGSGTEVDSSGYIEQLTPDRRRADREGLKGL